MSARVGQAGAAGGGGPRDFAAAGVSVAEWFSRRGEPGRFGAARTVNAIVGAGVRPGALQLDRRRAA